MAKTKQVAVVAEEPTRELSKTIVIDGNTYNINAKTVEKTNHPLVINQITLSDTVPMTFDGSSNQTIDIVSAEGGRFRGKIAVPSATTADFEADKQMVVNYNDIKSIVLDQFINNSVLSTWDGNKLEMGGESASIKSVGIVTGKNGEVNAFAEYNFNKKTFAAFIYVADNGLIYFGNADSSSVTDVELSAKNAVHANEADKLVGNFNNTAVECTVNNILNNTNEISNIKNGTTIVPKANSAAAADSLTSVLPPDKGGTGQTDLSKVTVGAADKALQDYNGNYFTTYYQKKITVSTSAPTASNGSDGDIWIKYS